MQKKEKRRFTSKVIAFKFLVILGIVEVLSFIQIKSGKEDLTEAEKITNMVITYLYVIFKSFRGCFIASIYLQKKKLHMKFFYKLPFSKPKQLSVVSTTTV